MNSTGYSKMSTAMYLMTLAALFKIITTTACQGDKDQLYRIFPFETSTGIYYEYQGLIRRTASIWRVVSFLDTDKLHQNLEVYRRKLKILPGLCQPILEGECEKLVLEYHLETKLKAANNLQGEIIREMSELNRQTRNKLPAHLPDSLRRRRTTPLLGFLGSITGPVAGLVTYEDGQRIENEINNLNRVAANLSHLVGRQTHVIRTHLRKCMDNLRPMRNTRRNSDHKL